MKEQNKIEVAEAKLSYQTNVPASQRKQIKHSRDSYQAFAEDWDDIELCETFKVLLLNRANKVLGVIMISKGGTAGTVVDAKHIFAAAILSMASAIILAHNHPSGSIHPSQADIELTRKIIDGGKLLDIVVLDHLILTRDDYYSFADSGEL